MHQLTRHTQTGTTLVELVIVMVITGILAASAGMLFVAPMRAYVDVSRRAQLVDLADTSLRLMQRELRAALPNSISISGDTITFLPIRYAGRYRANGSGALDFTSAATSFNVFDNAVPDPAGSRLAIFPVDATQLYLSDAAITLAGSGSITPTTTTLTKADGSEDLITLSSPFLFAESSPEQRFYLVDAPISYVCNEGTGQITRTQSSSALLVQQVSQCQFSYSTGTASRHGLVTLQLTLSDSGETITLLEQVHVDNAP